MYIVHRKRTKCFQQNSLDLHEMNKVATALQIMNLHANEKDAEIKLPASENDLTVAVS